MRPERWRRDAHCIADLRRMAQRVLPRPIFDFADGGAEDEHTLRRNEQAFDDITLLPRPLNGAAERDFGLRAVRPSDFLARDHWPDRSRGSVLAGRRSWPQRAPQHRPERPIVSAMGQSARLKRSTGRRATLDAGLYLSGSRLHARACRASSCGWLRRARSTVDNQLLGRRERDLRNGFTIPPRYRLRDAFAMATKLPWLLRMRRELPRITFGNYARPGETGGIEELASRMARLLDPAMSWADVDALRTFWKGPSF